MFCELTVSLVMISPDSSFLEYSVHPLNLAVGPGIRFPFILLPTFSLLRQDCRQQRFRRRLIRRQMQHAIKSGPRNRHPTDGLPAGAGQPLIAKECGNKGQHLRVKVGKASYDADVAQLGLALLR